MQWHGGTARRYLDSFLESGKLSGPYSEDVITEAVKELKKRGYAVDAKLMANLRKANR